MLAGPACLSALTVFCLKRNSCHDDCEYTTKDGTKGRYCDDTCEDGNPYGTNGCNAEGGKHGPYCRTCYYSLEKALKLDMHDNRAIM